MSILPSKVFVGLDYHQHTVQVCVLDEHGKQLVNATRPNSWQAVAEVVPDGVYLPKVWLAPLKTRELRRLIRYRQQQVNDRKSEKLRCRAILRDLRLKHPENIWAWTKPWLQWLATLEMPEQSRWAMDQHLIKIGFLNGQIKQAEDRMKESIRGDALTGWLLAQEGIGLVTALTLRAEIGRFDRFRTGKQLARFCCITPWNASSGDRQSDAGLIKAGNRELRRVLIEAAHRLKRYSERWSALSAKMKDRGKAPGVISAAVANRWIRSLYYQERAAAKEGYRMAA